MRLKDSCLVFMIPEELEATASFVVLFVCDAVISLIQSTKII